MSHMHTYVPLPTPQPPPPRKYVAKICTRRLRPKVQPLILLYTIWKERVSLSYTYYWEKVLLARTYLPLIPGAFRQKHNYWKFWRFSAWKWAKLVLTYSKKAFATWQHAFLFTSTTFYDIFSRACTEIKIVLDFFSFSYLFAAVIDLLLGLLPV